jgi:hypothetical protein
MEAKRTNLNAWLIVPVLLLTMACAAGGQTIFVDANAVGANNGTSWADAYNCLQDALAAASSGAEVRVAQGTYKPDRGATVTASDRTATFQLASGVTMRGGYAGSGAPDPNARDINAHKTILSGDLKGDEGLAFAHNSENSYHVVTGSGMDATAVIDGFIITAGNANGYFLDGHHAGGGMRNVNGSPTIKSCVFKQNWGIRGSGMANSTSSPTVINCTFTGNSSWYGAAMYNEQTSNPVLVNCTFSGNSAAYGGGIGNRDASSPSLTNCVFSNNLANCGGAIANHYDSSPTLINCTFTANSAHTAGGGMWNDASSGVLGTVTNCIFWANMPDEIYPKDGTMMITYTCLGGGWAGDGNIDADPLFADANNRDYQLLPGSPCIDAGNSTQVPPDYTDLDNDANPTEPIPWDIQGPAGPGRINGAAVDIGAYEAVGPPPPVHNIAPVANAGYDQAVFTPMDGTAVVSLGGSGSYDQDGNSLTYLWRWTIADVNYTAEGISPTIRLPAGRHIIELTVNDGFDDSLPDQVVVTVTGPIQTELRVYPQPICRRSGQAGIFVQLRLPDGVTPTQVGGAERLSLYPGGIMGRRPPHYMYRELGIPPQKRISAFFLKNQLLEAISPQARSVELKVVGQLASGQYFYGSETVPITP